MISGVQEPQASSFPELLCPPVAWACPLVNPARGWRDCTQKSNRVCPAGLSPGLLWGSSSTEVSRAMSPGEGAVPHPCLWKCPSRTTWLCCHGRHLSWFCAGTERTLRHQCTSCPAPQGIPLQETRGVAGELCWEQGEEAEHSPRSCRTSSLRELLCLPPAGLINISVPVPSSSC